MGSLRSIKSKQMLNPYDVKRLLNELDATIYILARKHLFKLDPSQPNPIAIRRKGQLALAKLRNLAKGHHSPYGPLPMDFDEVGTLKILDSIGNVIDALYDPDQNGITGSLEKEGRGLIDDLDLLLRGKKP